MYLFLSTINKCITTIIAVHKNDLKITLSHNIGYHNYECSSSCGLKQTASDNAKMKKKKRNK